MVFSRFQLDFLVSVLYIVPPAPARFNSTYMQGIRTFLCSFMKDFSHATDYMQPTIYISIKQLHAKHI